jgi:tetratricopeptide (TPR) repeat protein
LPEAIALYEHVRNAEMTILGADHPHTLRTMGNLATAYWSTNQLEKSVPLFEDVLKRQEAKLGRQHPDSKATIGNLGVNYKDGGRVLEAIPLLEEAYQARHECPALRAFGVQLLDTYVKGRMTIETAELVQEQLAEVRKTVPQVSPQLAGVLAQYGSTLLKVKAWANAEPLLRECLAIREKAEPDAWTTFNTKSILGQALAGKEQYADAEPLLLAGYAGLKKNEAAIPPQAKIRLIEALQRLVDFYNATVQAEKADEWQKKLEETKIAEEKPKP